MSWKDCAEQIRAAAGRELDDDDVEAIFDAVEQRARARRAQSSLPSATQALMDAAAELGAEARVAAMLEKRSRMINVLTTTERFARYDSAEGKEALVLEAINVGRISGEFGAAKSVDAEAQAVRDEFIGPMLAELKKGGLLNLMRNGRQLWRDVAKEMWRLTEPGAQASGNENAAQIAAIIGKYQEAARLKTNEAGGFVRKLPGWIVRQSHDSYKIAHASATNWREHFRKGGTEADRDAWKQFILPKLSDYTFRNVGVDAAARSKFLDKVWSQIVAGEHFKAGGADDFLGGFSGPGNLAKRLSQERTLHFKSSDDWFDYNERFGSGNLWESIHGGLNGAARNIALMRVWGTNPEAAFTKDLEKLIKRATNRGDFDTVKRLKGTMTRAHFDAVTGALNIPGNPTMAAWGQFARNLQSMARLGGVVISSIPDIAVRASALRHHGISYLEGVQNGLQSVIRGRGDGWVREFGDYMNIGTGSLTGGIHNSITAADGVVGKTSKAMDWFFRANLLNWWTDSMKTGVGEILSRNLARNAELAYDGLNADLRRSLGRYGIDAELWDRIRQQGLKKADDGTAFVTAEGLDAKAATALRMYFVDTVNEAMTIGGARERAIVSWGGLRPGTPAGEAIRMLMQFKSFPITFYQKSWRREFQRKGRIDGGGLMWLVVGTTSLGYLSMTAKDLVKGRMPRKPENITDAGKLFLASMQQGGGLGIYGDFLFGQYNRFGGGLVDTLAGPTAGSLDEFGRLWSDGWGKFGKILAGETGGPSPGADLVRFAQNHAPFMNLFYARLATDWLFMWHVNEAMSPGWAERYERKVKEDNNQTFWLSPAKTVKRGRMSALQSAVSSSAGRPRMTGGGGSISLEGRSL